ncbi:DoxX family protein [Diaminobutyricimonas sp. LJ205]|uniref:DoxX family protein n=1 Tax=Diaminobutyricimonas sp. LJ205 TaxID=2683590 RepID=UPI0012F4C76B|nr:DoxX family protein [Diaminobutyricimonas sp. LJ205]
MDIALWIVAGIAALLFLAAGAMKALQPKEKLATSMGWVDDFSTPQVKLIGIAEVLGALGLILPALFNTATILVPIAATGVAVIMIGAMVVHARRGEAQMIPINVVLFALAAFVAVGRFFIEPF